MRLLEQIRLWACDNFFRKRAARLQHLQVTEHRQLIEEVKQQNRSTLHDLADAVLRLQAVSERLEDSIEELGDD